MHLSPEISPDIEQFIYEAAVIPEQWPQVLQALAEIGEGFGAVLFSVSEVRTQWTASPAIQPIMRDFVQSGWAARNTRMAGGIRRGAHLLSRFVTEADCFEPDAALTDPMYREFFLPVGWGRPPGWLRHCRTATWSASVSRSRRRAVRWERRPCPASTNCGRIWRGRRCSPPDLGWNGSARRSRRWRNWALPPPRSTARARSWWRIPAFSEASAPWTTGAGDRIALLDRAANQLLHRALDSIDGSVGVRSFPLRNPDTAIRHVLHSGAGASACTRPLLTRRGHPCHHDIFPLRAIPGALAGPLRPYRPPRRSSRGGSAAGKASYKSRRTKDEVQIRCATS